MAFLFFTIATRFLVGAPKIRFERRSTSTKWFDLELSVSDSDLEIIEGADMDNGLYVTNKGLVLLTKDQKDLLKFVKKYTQYESEAKIHEDGEQAEDEGVNKFILPFNRAEFLSFLN